MEPVVEPDMLVVSVSMDVPDAPMLPLPERRLTVPAVRVAPPDLVIFPAPLAVTFVIPVVPVETLALMATLVLPVSVDSEIVPLPDMLSALEIVRPLPEITVISPDVSTIGPKVTVPEALIVKSFAPNVMVCPDDENVPPLRN